MTGSHVSLALAIALALAVGSYSVKAVSDTFAEVTAKIEKINAR